MTGATPFYHTRSSTYFYNEDLFNHEAFINVAYEVSGRVLDRETSSYLTFECEFNTIEEANDYFDKMKKKYPLSKIKLYKSTWQELRTFL